jgi:hypothetical protein
MSETQVFGKGVGAGKGFVACCDWVEADIITQK